MVAVLNTNEIYERESRRFANLRNINSPVQFRPSRVVVKHSLARSRDEQRARLFIFFFFIFSMSVSRQIFLGKFNRRLSIAFPFFDQPGHRVVSSTVVTELYKS